MTEALEARGLRVGRVDWSDASVDWRLTRAALFRTTWDYFCRFEEFKSWLHRAAEQTQLINPATVIAWNFDKFYLQDLMTAGVEVAPLSSLSAATRGAWPTCLARRAGTRL